MFRHAARAALRSSQSSLAPARTVAGRRYITTEPPHMKSRGWKNSALRWGIAIAGIYYYNTSPVFADHPQNNLLNPNLDALDDDSGSSTIDALTASSRRKPQRDASILQSAIERNSEIAASDSPAATGTPQDNPMVAAPAVGAAELEEEAEGEGAFNPVTGEINWDCPCLGGMAYGPCGPEFREAFSCFVYSQAEPKGMNCVDKFEKMQTCFRANPEVYKDELEGDDELDESLAQEKQELEKEIAERRAALDAQAGGASQGRLLEERGNTPAKSAKSDKSSSTKSSRNAGKSKSTPAQSEKTSSEEKNVKSESYDNDHEHGGPSSILRTPRVPSVSEAISEAEELLPKAAHDAAGSTGMLNQTAGK